MIWLNWHVQCQYQTTVLYTSLAREPAGLDPIFQRQESPLLQAESAPRAAPPSEQPWIIFSRSASTGSVRCLISRIHSRVLNRTSDEPAILTGSTAATHHPWTHLNLDGSRIFRSIRTPAAYFDWIDGTQAVPDV